MHPQNELIFHNFSHQPETFPAKPLLAAPWLRLASQASELHRLGQEQGAGEGGEGGGEGGRVLLGQLGPRRGELQLLHPHHDGAQGQGKLGDESKEDFLFLICRLCR